MPGVDAVVVQDCVNVSADVRKLLWGPICGPIGQPLKSTNFSEVEYCALPQLRFGFSFRFRIGFRFRLMFKFRLGLFWCSVRLRFKVMLRFKIIFSFTLDFGGLSSVNLKDGVSNVKFSFRFKERFKFRFMLRLKLWCEWS